MKIITTSLIIGVLFLCSEAEPETCPDGYDSDHYGLCEQSRESCRSGYYHVRGHCKACPCNNHEESCEIDECSRVRCHCHTGYTGKYCQNYGGEQMESEEALQIIVKPIMQTTYRNFDGINASCIVNDSNARVMWLRNNGIYTDERGERVNRTFRIDKARDSDNGSYICLAIRGRKAFKAIASIEIREATVPIARITDTNITKKIGDQVKLTCGAEGDPQPKVQWKKFSSATKSYQIVKSGTLKSAVLEMTSLSADEAGLYLCSAENLAGSDNKSVQVIIKQPVLRVYPENPHIVIAGDSITLDCRETVGYSDMSFTWSREDGLPLATNVYQSANGSLTITNIAINQEGNYTCSAVKGVASASVTTRIVVRTVPLIDNSGIFNENVTEKLGERVELTCNAEGHPEPNVLWRKFSFETKLYRIVKPATPKSAVFEITSLSADEAGLYLCSAENPAGSDTKSVQVIIKQPILRVYPEDHHIVIAGDSITLDCRETVGYSDMSFTWSREDGLPLATNVYQSGNGSLTITNIAINQEGNYTCSAVKGIAFASVTTRIVVRTVPVIDNSGIFNENVTEKLGERVELTCKAEGHPEPNVLWRKFSSATKLYRIVKPATPKSAVFEITSLSADEAGLYLCSAENAAGSDNKSVQVIIKQPVLRVYPEGSHIVIAGDSITLDCRETVGYSDMSFTWSREDGLPLATNVYQSANGSLTITNIAINQEGNYTCSAVKGVASASVTTRIVVRTVPVIDNSGIFNENVTEKLGERVELTCKAEGHPEPNVLWRKFSSATKLYRIVKPATPKSAVFEITSLSADEAGLYLCSAENPAGSDNKSVQVIIKQPVLRVYPEGFHIVIAGDSITLDCRETVGYSDMSFTWSREDGLPLATNVYQSANGSLTITNIAINQEGNYTCSAVKGVASASVTTRIVVRTVPVIDNSGIFNENVTEKLGERVELTCKAEGHPEPNVLWRKFSSATKLYRIVKPATPKSAVFEITSLSADEAGLYLCSAENPAGSDNKSVQVIIKQPVLRVYPEGSHIVIAGDLITLDCRETVGYLDMSFTWSREVGLPLATNVYQSANGSLTITNIAINQEGNYTCSAVEGVASASVTTRIVVRTVPVIDNSGIFSENVTEKLGERVELTCKAEGHPEPNVLWRKFSSATKSYRIVKPATPKSAVFEITSLSADEAGLYLCSAENPAGSDNKSVQVIIKRPVLRVYPEDHHIVIAGDSITLDCRETVGYSDMSFTWSREDGLPLATNVYQSANGSLTITNIAINQEGNYTCSAVKGIASASVTTRIVVRTVPVIDNSGIFSENVTEKLGERVELTCKAEGHPEPNVLWRKFSSATKSYRIVKPATPKSAVFEITSLSADEAGLYLCSAENPAGSDNKSVQVIIKQPVLRVYPEGFHIVIAGDSITLDCRETVGYSDMSFTWSREVGLPLATNVYQSANGSLTITNIAINQEGNYTCSAVKGVASASVTTRIVVRTVPVIDNSGIFSENVTEKLGERVELTCKAEGHPEPNVLWRKFSSATKSYRIVKPATPKSAVFEITSLSADEAGLYLCSAENPAGSDNKSVQVIIKQPVLRVYPEDHHIVIAGDSITLDCRETVGYSDMSFTWSREVGLPLATNVYQSANGSLTITNIAINQEGNYTCSAVKGIASASVTTRIVVRTVPVIDNSGIFSENVTEKLGERVELTCKAEGHPEPNVLWRKFSSATKSYRIVKPATPKSAVFEITSLSADEAGLYLCSAENPAGSDNKSVQVIIKQPVLRVYPEGSHIVIAGDSITLDCRETVGYLDMSFTWSREDGLPLATNVYQSANGSSTITNIAINQEGNYTCSAVKGVASASVTTRIVVRTVPVIDNSGIFNENVTEKLGERVELTCKAEGHPEPNVLWRKFSSATKLYRIVKPATPKSAVFEITSLSADEAGLYLCSAENPAGSDNKSVQVIIKQPVLRVYPEGFHIVIAGDSITLDCRETVGYSDMSFTWSREDGLPLATNVYQSANGSLTITNIAINQEGNYTCSAVKGVASAPVTTRIVVRTVPVIDNSGIFNENVTEKLGERVELTCKAEGHPEPNVLWKKFSSATKLYRIVKPATPKSAVLEITSLSADEAGLYLCSAENPAGSDNKSVQVIIKQPVLRVYPEGSHIVIAGDLITLDCRETVGYSDMSFTWSREVGLPLATNVYQSANGSLTITNIAINQEGNYTCSAVKGIASASVTTRIVVRTVPVIDNSGIFSENVTEKLGERVELTCKAEGHPEPNVLWRKFSSATKSYRIVKPATPKSAVFEITSLSADEAGLYLCSAENPAGSDNKSVQVIIKQPVLRVYPEGFHIVIAGDSITLDCRETVGYSDMSFTWSREAGLPLATNVYQSANGSLTITNIAINQEGNYTCSAVKGVASASVTTRIVVRTVPVIDNSGIFSENVTEKLGERVELTCKAEGHPEPNVLWRKFSSATKSYRIVKPATPKSAVFEITSLSADEAGLYLCSAENPAGSDNKSVQVIIKRPVLRVYPEDHHIVIAGDSITLDCRETVGYSDMSFTWSREDGLPLATNVYQSANGSLTITNIAINQEGNYTCSAVKGIASASVTTRIVVRTVPVIDNSGIFSENVTEKLGERVELTCKAEGHPEPNVLWRKFSSATKSYRIVKPATPKSAVFEITSLSADEAGLYLCSAENPAGSDNKSVQVIIKQPVLRVYPEDHHIVIAGDSITLDCRETVGYSDMSFTWSREDGLPLATNVYQSANGSLTITNIAINQEGHYTCSAVKGIASASVTTRIVVRTVPVIDNSGIFSENVTEKLGERVELTCKAEGHPEPNVLWRKFSSATKSYRIVKPATPKSAVFEITSLSADEAGLYLCSAENPAGSDNKSVQVIIKQPVLRVYPEGSHIVIAGDSITLDCRETVGYLDMSFTWSREDGLPLATNVYQSANGSSTITNIAINQEGNYTCSAVKGVASASVTTRIVVRTVPVIDNSGIFNENVTEKLGERVELTCKAEGHPEPNVLWRKFSSATKLYRIVKPATPKSAVFEITSLSADEAGLYLCSAENPAGSDNKSVQVIIKQPVLRVYPEGFHIVIAGDSITLDCRETVGYSDMSFTWSREDGLPLATNVYQSANGSLTITNIAINQEGNYTCSAVKGVASAPVTTRIVVRTVPVIDNSGIFNENVTEKLGERVELTCKAEGHPEPNVLWKKFSSATKLYRIVKPATPKSAVFEITSLSADEAGLYLCSAENPAGSDNKSVQVIIKQPVLRVYPEGSHIVIAGDLITLDCRETVGYSDMSFTWSREVGLPLATNVYQSFNGSLTITNIAINQEGNYTCSAVKGVASASVTTRIVVRTVPVIDHSGIFSENVTEKLGERVELTCKAEGHPEPNVLWRKFSSATKSYRIVKPATPKSAVFEITSLSADEAGLYLCSAENPAGSDNKSVQVIIKQPVLRVYPEGSHIVIAGDSITLDCRETVGYSDMNFTWAREDDCPFATNIYQSANGSLTITNIAINQGGDYKCSAVKGIASVSVAIQIVVRMPPDINIPEITDRIITQKLGGSVQLICEADGDPEPNVEWQKLSDKSNSYEAVGEATLTFAVHDIMSLSTNEAGTYLCLARNSAGSSNKTVRVIIPQTGWEFIKEAASNFTLMIHRAIESGEITDDFSKSIVITSNENIASQLESLMMQVEQRLNLIEKKRKESSLFKKADRLFQPVLKKIMGRKNDYEKIVEFSGVIEHDTELGIVEDSSTTLADDNAWRDLDFLFHQVKPLSTQLQEYVDMKGEDLCGDDVSANAYLYSLYILLSATEIMGLLTIDFRFGFLHNHDLDATLLQAQRAGITHLGYYFKIFKEAMGRAPWDNHACDPLENIRSVTFYEMDNLYQDILIDEYEIKPGDTCRGGCKTNPLKSYGDCSMISNCWPVESPTYCELDDARKRYSWLMDATNQIFGRLDSGLCPGKKVSFSESLYYGSWCEKCWCTCEGNSLLTREERFSATHVFSFLPSESDTARNMVVTGIKFVSKDGIVQIQIQEGQLGAQGLIVEDTQLWKDNPDMKSEILKARQGLDSVYQKGKDFLVFGSNSIINLDEVTVPDGHVVTGIKFGFSNDIYDYRDQLVIVIQYTPFSFASGILDHSSKSQWILSSEHHWDDISPERLISPEFSTIKNSPAPGSPSIIRFGPSSIKDDMGQTTLPFLDAVPVETVSDALSGIDLFYKSSPGYGGFLSFRLHSLNITKYMV